MTDFATLFMKVDASGMLEGDRALDRIVQKGGAAEAKVAKSLNIVGESGRTAGVGFRDAGTQAEAARC